ncbi:MAG TPA: glycogen synthase GlgA [Verrucomicrobiae bacterium]|nr:glycogen synthase GlgA [Verrucomicrobiae bacterium]
MAARKPKEKAAKKTPESLRVLFVSSECTPYAKTGGLGDMVAGLSKALRQLGHDARVLIPLYSQIDRAKHGLKPFTSACVHMGGKVEHWVSVQTAMLDDTVPIWFLDFDSYFGRPGIYDGPFGHYQDNAYRFALLSKAALQICKDQQWIPHVMHGHDWPSALVPVFLKTWDRFLSPLSNTASVLTIHNVGYPGVYDAGILVYAGLGAQYFTSDIFEDHGKANLLKAGIYFADALTTVSPTHAREILDPVGGMGHAPYLNNRRADLFGILNGGDYEHWNPETDRHIPACYSTNDMAGKAICKRALQERLHLETTDKLPLFGIVSRFAHQKGFNLLRAALPAALDDMLMQFVVLGSGDPDTENFFRWLRSAYPGRVGAQIGFDIGLSHLIEAGSDFFLMPSLYEPCGLNQIYSLKYGTLPVVRATGGLDDTVQNYNEATGDGTGFKFWEPSAPALYYCIGWAVSTWFDRPQHIVKLRQQAMVQDFSWPKSAQRYVEVYRHALRKRQTALR